MELAGTWVQTAPALIAPDVRQESQVQNVPTRQQATEFRSVLDPPGSDTARQQASADTLHDLALDQILERLATRGEDLAAAFRSPLQNEAAVRYRQAVFVDLEDRAIRAAVTDFVDALHVSGDYERSATASHDRYPRARLHLTAVQRYVAAVLRVVDALGAALGASPGSGSAALRGFLRYLHRDVVSSAGFIRLRSESQRLEEEWRAIRYDVLIQSSRVTVAPFDDEPDLTAEVEAAFARFRQGAVHDYRAQDVTPTFDHVQGWILESVAELFPDLFADLQAFLTETASFTDPVVTRFADELPFYLTYLDYLQPLRDAGLPVCYPAVSVTDKTFSATDTADLALARALVGRQAEVVVNDLHLSGVERILVISGPNQGGKSTTARAFGQLHHLAAIGCPVPGREVRTFLPDHVLTHFEREEQLETLEGRLGNEVRRIHDLLQTATPRSVIVLNEIFPSTALEDARLLTAEVLRRISELDALCVCVTFLDELSRVNEQTVSMVSAIDPADPAVRTFRMERRYADGRAYALALAGKHGLTFGSILRRVEHRKAER